MVQTAESSGTDKASCHTLAERDRRERERERERQRERERERERRRAVTHLQPPSFIGCALRERDRESERATQRERECVCGCVYERER